MTQQEFITKLLPYAQAAEAKYRVPALVALAQAALESGWGAKAPGNMYFGVKADKSWKGEKQLITTTEIHSTADVKYPVIVNIEKITTGKNAGKYKYTVKDYFRAYESPAGSFEDYAKFLVNNSRYSAAFKTSNPIEFAKAIAAAGYATATNYFDTLQVLIQQIKKKAQSYGLLPAQP